VPLHRDLHVVGAARRRRGEHRDAVQRRLRAALQFLAFYQNDLEILPGATMNLHGPVHTNGNLYLNSDATPR
jgi:hypothetical protein